MNRRFGAIGPASRALVAAVLLGAVVGGLNPSAYGQVTRPDPTKTKSSDSLRAVFKEVVAAADKSTVSVRGENEKDKTKFIQVALGTIVAADGFILTKASEVVGFETLKVMISGKLLEAKVVGVSEPQDLAMLKVDATELPVAPWADSKADKIEVGEWVACSAAGTGNDQPIAVGVVSVGRRKIAGRNGFLGVQLADAAENGGAKILQVITDSSAEKAGVKVDDVITAVNGTPTKDKEALILAMHAYRPGDVVSLAVKRGDKDMDLKASLGANAGNTNSRFNMMNLMAGPVSRRSSDFTAVLQHDTVIRPADCGGPLVDLSGKVIGINIARAGRTETYALPADIVLPLLDPLKSGKLAPVNANRPGPAKPGEKATTMPEHGE